MTYQLGTYYLVNLEAKMALTKSFFQSQIVLIVDVIYIYEPISDILDFFFSYERVFLIVFKHSRILQVYQFAKYKKELEQTECLGNSITRSAIQDFQEIIIITFLIRLIYLTQLSSKSRDRQCIWFSSQLPSINKFFLSFMNT